MTRTCQGNSAYRSVKSSAVNRKWTAGYRSQAVATLFFFFSSLARVWVFLGLQASEESYQNRDISNK